MSEALALVWFRGLVCDGPIECLLIGSRLSPEGGVGKGATYRNTLFTWASAWWKKQIFSFLSLVSVPTETEPTQWATWVGGRARYVDLSQRAWRPGHLCHSGPGHWGRPDQQKQPWSPPGSITPGETQTHGPPHGNDRIPDTPSGSFPAPRKAAGLPILRGSWSRAALWSDSGETPNGSTLTTKGLLQKPKPQAGWGWGVPLWAGSVSLESS